MRTSNASSVTLCFRFHFQVIKDYQLFMVVGVLLTIDLAIMTTWQVFDPFYRDTKTMEPRVSKYLQSLPYSSTVEDPQHSVQLNARSLSSCDREYQSG